MSPSPLQRVPPVIRMIVGILLAVGGFYAVPSKSASLSHGIALPMIGFGFFLTVHGAIRCWPFTIPGVRLIAIGLCAIILGAMAMTPDQVFSVGNFWADLIETMRIHGICVFIMSAGFSMVAIGLLRFVRSFWGSTSIPPASPSTAEDGHLS